MFLITAGGKSFFFVNFEFALRCLLKGQKKEAEGGEDKKEALTNERIWAAIVCFYGQIGLNLN